MKTKQAQTVKVESFAKALEPQDSEYDGPRHWFIYRHISLAMLAGDGNGVVGTFTDRTEAIKEARRRQREDNRKGGHHTTFIVFEARKIKI